MELKELKIYIGTNSQEKQSNFQQLNDRIKELNDENDRLNKRVLDVEDENSDLRDKIRSMVQ